MPIEILHPPRAAVLKVSGINCDHETLSAFEIAGAPGSEIVHLNQFITGEKNLGDFQILTIPGGFSFGDDFGSGRLLSLELRNRFADKLEKHLDAGRLVLGICNGFQVLVQLGLLPFGKISELSDLSSSLSQNQSARFEARWVQLKVTHEMFFDAEEDIISLPVAHGEGRFVTNESVISELEQKGLIGWKYCIPTGEPTQDYPQNPNGSVNAIAGLVDPSGQVIGLMPHPERFVRIEQHPNWRRVPDIAPQGLPLFEKIVSRANEI